MTLWTRWGLLIPILWMMGFVVFYWVNHFTNGFVPDKWIVTVGHLLGTIFVWIFSITLGATSIKEVIDAKTEESTIIEMPHKFLFFSAKMWGLILTIAVGWFLYNPPPKAWLDEAFLQKAALEKKIKDVSEEAKEKLQAKPTEPATSETPVAVVSATVMREWVNAEGKKLKAKCVGVMMEQGKRKVRFVKEDGTEVPYDFEKLSADDQRYVNERFPQ
jgi:acyl-CoA synthetase (AMP-forming)/AMP-acid ligase II